MRLKTYRETLSIHKVLDELGVDKQQKLLLGP